jgi:hypothetical protein
MAQAVAAFRKTRAKVVLTVPLVIFATLWSSKQHSLALILLISKNGVPGTIEH